ncbi:hypothetical protein VNO77_21508 [Canavalia gladiata]|uniref:Uncharacterized protein n=1 Tax=Canavalia gladiata TaxID=3824 RepID=A0AAN9LR71_CANGL
MRVCIGGRESGPQPRRRNGGKLSFGPQTIPSSQKQLFMTRSCVAREATEAIKQSLLVGLGFGLGPELSEVKLMQMVVVVLGTWIPRSSIDVKVMLNNTYS